MYVRMARREERQARAQFGADYERHAVRTPRSFPRFGAPIRQA